MIEDIELVFQNCRTYNAESAEEYMCGNRLEKYFKKEARRLGLLEDAEEDTRPSKKARKTL